MTKLILSRLHFFFPVFFIAISLFTPASAIAMGKTVLPDPGVSEKPVIPRFYWMEDAARTLTINDVTDEKYGGRFTLSNSGSLGLGISGSAFWVRFTVVNSSSKTADWILENDHPLWDFVEFYAKDENGVWTTKRAGDHVPFAEREIAYRKSTFHAIIPPGAERTFFIRLYFEKLGSAKIKITLWPEDVFHNGNTTEYILLGLYFGAMAVMFFYNLFLLFSVGDRSYLWYILYVFGISLCMFAYNGLAFQYLWPTSSYMADYAGPLSGFAGYFFAALFSRSFLDTRRHTPWLDKFILICAAVSFAGLAFGLFSWWTVMIQLLYWNMVVAGILFIIAAVIRLAQGYRPARFYLISWSAVAVGMLTLSLKDMGVLPYNALTLWAPQIGTWLDVVLLSFALADRINFITVERESAMEKAASLSERLQAVMDNTLAVIYMKDPEGRFVAINRQFEKLFGVTRNVIAGKTDYELFPKNVAEAFRLNDEMVLKAGEPLELEETVPLADGLHTYISIKFPLRDGTGKINAICGISTDITERKRAEDELRRFFNLIPDMVCIASADGRFLKINPMWVTTLGYTEQEILSTPFLDFIHPDDRERTMKEVERQIGGEATISFINRYRCKDGGYKILEWMATPAVDKKLLFAAARDITERKRAEAEIISTQNQLKATLDAIPDLLFELGLDGRYYDYHSPQTDLLAAPPDMLLGRLVSEMLPPPAADVVLSALREAHENGRSFGKQFELALPQGAFWFELSVAPKPAVSGQEPRFIVMSRDITARKKAEEFLITSHEKLEHQVRARTVDLMEANEALIEARNKAEDATRAKDKFINLLSHDLKSPLSSLSLIIDMLLADKANPPPESQKALMKKAKNRLRSLVTMIEDLLKMSRIQSEGMRPRKRLWDLRSLIIHNIETVEEMAVKKGVTLRNEVPPGLTLFVDMRLVSQVILNLLSNAIKFSRSGGEITVSGGLDGGIFFTVKDDGVGVDPEVLPEIFNHEVRTSTLGTDGEIGTGFGLPFCKDIVERHGGTIEVRSVTGVGSEFTVKIPEVKTIALVVDDQEVARRAIIGQIRKLGVEALEAENGVQAMSILAEVTPNIIITDLSMPEMDGFGLLEKIRGGEALKATPVIIATSSDDAQNRRRAFDLGADDFVSKPVQERDLLPRVKRLLERGAHSG